MRLVLGSSSKYRQSLLRRIITDFDIDSPSIDEIAHDREPPRDFAQRMALEKAQVVAKRWQQRLILGSDQIAYCINPGNDAAGSGLSTQDTILGKPENHAKAKQQLAFCSGQSVVFYTTCCLINTDTGKQQRFSDTYTLHFKSLNEDLIETYLQKEQPYNCAGSIKTEGLGIALIARHEGDDPSCLIGLPLIKLISALEAENYRVI